MQVQKISNNNTNFQRGGAVVKNTFERQMSIAKADHLEAKARLHYMKFKKAENALGEVKDDPFVSVKETWKLIKVASTMIYHKLQSARYVGESSHYRYKFDRAYLNDVA